MLPTFIDGLWLEDCGQRLGNVDRTNLALVLLKQLLYLTIGPSPSPPVPELKSTYTLLLILFQADIVFGKLRGIIPLHADLHSALIRLRCPTTGISSQIGQVLFKWVERVQEPYVEYCASLIRVSQRKMLTED